MRKNLVLYFFIVTTLTLSCVSRHPSSVSSQHDFYFGIKTIDDTKKMLLIGNLCEARQAACYDWEKLGFESIKGSDNKASAKFVITINEGILEDAYTFEYGNYIQKRMYSSQENNNSPLYKYIKFPKKFKTKLPKHFLNVSEPKRQRLPYSLLSHMLTGLDFTPLSAYSSTIREIVELFENKKVYQASYLSRIVELALIDDQLHELKEFIGKEQLLSLGSALRIRYRGQITSPITSIGTLEHERNEYYKQALLYKTKTQSINMSKLVQRANEENLTVKVYSRDLAILFYDPKRKLHPKRTNSLLLNIQKKPSLQAYRDKSNGNLVPLGVFIMSDALQPLQVLNFEKFKVPLRDERITKFLEYGVTLGLSFIVNPTVATTAKAGNFIAKLVLRKNGKVYKKVLIETEANFRALLDSGIVNFDSTEISLNLLTHFLEDAGFDPEVVQFYKRKLNGTNKSEVDRTLKDIFKIFQSKQTSKRVLSNLNQKNAIINRLYATKAFENFMLDQRSQKKLIKRLEKRKTARNRRKKKRERKLERKEAKREPSSAQGSAIVFMIDGLRPDRFKEAIKKGLMPNLKKHFIDNGIEFDSFTTKSLTLPSWSSILTGYDIDEHGVKSNGPMSRLLGSPNQNYIDARKDLLLKKNRKKSRSLQHLKESGLQWLPDYFAKKEVITNYLPINQEVFPAVGKMIKVIRQEYDKILFGNFSGSIALDRAGAMQTAKKIKKSPGNTRLILNWYTCVDVFAHHNNLAIDECYKELDNTAAIVLKAAKKDPILKDAHLFIISDHGHTGGHESHESRYKLFEDGSYFNNTSLNLTTLLSGDYAQYSHFDFFPYVMESPHINNDLKFLVEYQLQPFKYKYKSKKKKYKKRKPDVMIDYSGDAMAQIYLRKKNSSWMDQISFYQLTHLNGRNLLEDLLSVKVNNYVIYDKKTKDKIDQMTKGHPIMAYATALKTCQFSDINKIVNEKISHNRPAVLVKGLKSDFGLILTQLFDNKIHYKYFLLKEFKQDKAGRCTGVLSQDSKKDVLKHYNKTANRWISKLDFINEMREEDFPTSLVTLVANLTLADNLKDNLRRQAESPDFLLLPNIGFNFNSAAITEADHGNLRREEVNNSFFVSRLSGMSSTKKQRSSAKEKIVLNSFLTPFVLDITQKHNKFSNKNWPSIYDYIDKD